MRVLARIGCTLAGLALIVPAAAWAGMPSSAKASSSKKLARTPQSVRLCANCQRQILLQQGINVPPPPPLPAGTPVAGENCTQCGAPTAVVSGSMAPAMGGQVVMNGAMMADEAPGYASTGDQVAEYVGNGVDPAPVGAFTQRMASNVPMPRTGLRDNAVVPTSLPPEPVGIEGVNRPHVISHLFGFSAIGRERAMEREKRKREKHASIPYGPTDPKVNELPAKMVYGRSGH